MFCISYEQLLIIIFLIHIYLLLKEYVDKILKKHMWNNLKKIILNVIHIYLWKNHTGWSKKYK